ncbi:MAG: DNA mismatch repair protein [Lachnospiraceae bacterium]|nr:DNA mismatch repair protein [Lachnospiraceae bacterium]
MAREDRVSLLYPKGSEAQYKTVSETTMHDLWFDELCAELTDNKQEQNAIMQVLSKVTEDPATAEYRSGVFDDIYRNPKMCERMLELLDKINFLRDYGAFKKKYDETAGVWDLMHRLEEMNEYIGYVEAMHECLKEAEIGSEGLVALKEHIDRIYHDNGYDVLKEDIGRLKASTASIKSVTLGINLNERFEASSMGIVSINAKEFTRSNIIGRFYDKMASGDRIEKDTEWDENFKYYPLKADAGLSMDQITKISAFASGMKSPVIGAQLAAIPSGDSAEEATRYMNREADHLISLTVKHLRETLNRYMTITITEVTDLIPELMFYIRFADYVKKLTAKGLSFCRSRVCSGSARQAGTGQDAGLGVSAAAGHDTDPGLQAAAGHDTKAVGFYNLKLTRLAGDGSRGNASGIVKNDLSFAEDSLVYILTGANRGGKTTITQAVGQLFILAQAGIYVPAEEFEYEPVDCIFTHFPADEDKTMDLGRLGEECKRFREIFFEATGSSLILLNETFSTTSFEEGYYIAKDSVRAIAEKRIRCIYNTHMHKLAFDLAAESGGDREGAQGGAESGPQNGNYEAQGAGSASRDSQGTGKWCVRSLVMSNENDPTPFKARVAPPEGLSYARTIAEKYGVTFESLTERSE